MSIAVADAATAAFSSCIGEPQHTGANHVDEKAIAFRQVVGFGEVISEHEDVGGVYCADIWETVEGVPEGGVECCSCAEELFLAVCAVKEAAAGSEC